MRIVRLRRYPVKAMGGEDVAALEATARGFAGDREFAVADAQGHLAAGKRTGRFRPHDEVFGYSARGALGAGLGGAGFGGGSGDVGGAGGAGGGARGGASGGARGVVVTAGENEWPVDHPDLARHLSAAVGKPMRVIPFASSAYDFFDDSPISLVGTATLDWCARELGADADPRRLRVNMVIETSEPFIEETWLGRDIVIGGGAALPLGTYSSPGAGARDVAGVRLHVTKQNTRCRVIDLAQDGVTATTSWLKPLGSQRDAKVAVYARVVTPGIVRVGDAVTNG